MEKKSGNNAAIGNGFFFGIVVGVALTLLFTTKKGRKILRMLIDEGADKLTEIEDLLTTQTKEHAVQKASYQPQEETDYISQPAPLEQPIQESTLEPHEHAVHMPEDSGFHIEESPAPPRQEETMKQPSSNGAFHKVGRRFFRGIPKRS